MLKVTSQMIEETHPTYESTNQSNLQTLKDQTPKRYYELFATQEDEIVELIENNDR
jgi:hypothetical protein